MTIEPRGTETAGELERMIDLSKFGTAEMTKDELSELVADWFSRCRIYGDDGQFQVMGPHDNEGMQLGARLWQLTSEDRIRRRDQAPAGGAGVVNLSDDETDVILDAMMVGLSALEAWDAVLTALPALNLALVRVVPE